MKTNLGNALSERHDALAAALTRGLEEVLKSFLGEGLRITDPAAGAGMADGEGIVVSGLLQEGASGTPFKVHIDSHTALEMARSILGRPAEGLQEALPGFSTVAGEILRQIRESIGATIGESPAGEVLEIAEGSLSPAAGVTRFAFGLRSAGVTGTLTIDIGPALEVHEMREEGATEISARPPEVLMDLELPFALTLGSVELDLGTISDMRPGSVVPLGRAADGPVQLVVGGRTIARGELVVVEGCFGIRVDSVETAERRLKTLGRV